MNAVCDVKTEKRREDSARRALACQGFRLCKSRRRDPYALDFGGYLITDLYIGAVIKGDAAIWKCGHSTSDRYASDACDGS